VVLGERSQRAQVGDAEEVGKPTRPVATDPAALTFGQS
jgi:hypothetical protein